MSRIRKELRSSLFDAAASNLQPHTLGVQLMLKLPNRQRGVTLVNSRGQVTPAGRFFYEARGQAPPSSTFDPTQTPISRGGREYIRLLNGTEVLVRSYLRGQWHFTKMGRMWASQVKTRYILKMPVHPERTDGKGLREDVTAFFPVDVNVSIPASLTGSERDARLLEFASQFVKDLPDNGLVLDDYGAQWYIARDWKNLIREDHEKVFIPDGHADARPSVDVVMDRPLRGQPYLFANGLQSSICSAAFEDAGGRCDPPSALYHPTRRPTDLG